MRAIKTVYRSIIKLSFMCAGLLAGGMLLPGISAAQDDCVAPPVKMVWDIGPDNYYALGDWPVHFGGPTADCDSAGVYCSPVWALNYQLKIDDKVDGGGNTMIPFSIASSAIVPEGEHNAEISFDARFLCPPTATDQHIDVARAFYVDNTPPVVILSKPENNVVIPAVELLLAGNIADSGSKLDVVDIRFSISGAVFRGDLAGKPFQPSGTSSLRAVFCSDDAYTKGLNPCTVNMGGTPANFPVNYDLRDYVDLSWGQDFLFSVNAWGTDRVGHTATSGIGFTVDQAPPEVTINDPKIDPEWNDMHWTIPDEPVISGTAKDLSPITKVWLTIKDETANRYWNGAEWHATTATVNATEITGSTTVAWRYTGLSREVMRSGIFTVTAYAKDKFGHVGHAEVSGKNKKKYDLGSMEFTSVSMSMREVSNIGSKAVKPDSFTTDPEENTIFVSAKIRPARLAGVLNDYVMWDINGANVYSGNPNSPHGGNPSTFFVAIPPVIAVSNGRPGPMGYTVFPRIEYDYKDEHFTYYGPDHGSITQNNLDTLRQEYIDLRTGYELPGTSFDQDLPVLPGLLVSPGAEPAKHQWHILKYLNSKVTDLNDVLQGYGISLSPSSGYRCPIGNKMVGGERNSNHMLGRALDYSQTGETASEDNWYVWALSQDNGATEYLLYDQRGCRVNNGDVSTDAFDLPKFVSVKCPNQKEFSRQVTQYTHGHAAW
jgi:hypothetical protein